jgi:hypothetical protein
MKKLIFGLAAIALSGAIGSVNAQDTNELDSSLRELCGACFTVATHVGAFSKDNATSAQIMESPAYTFRMALLSMSQPVYDAVAEQDVVNGRLLKPEEAKSYISSEAGLQNVQLRAVPANEID